MQKENSLPAIVYVFRFLLTAVIFLVSLYQLPTQLATFLLQKIITHECFRNKLPKYRKQHLLLFTPRVLSLTILFVVFVTNSLAITLLVKILPSPLDSKILLTISGFFIVIVGHAIGSKIMGRILHIPRIEYALIAKGTVDCILDLGSFFSVFFVVATVVRIPYLILDFKSKDESHSATFRRRSYLQVPNAVADLVLLPVFLVNLLCVWSVKSFLGEFLREKNFNKKRVIVLKYFFKNVINIPIMLLLIVTIIVFPFRIPKLYKQLFKTEKTKDFTMQIIVVSNFVCGIYNLIDYCCLLILIATMWRSKKSSSGKKKIPRSKTFKQ
eukprot:Anaeramoba_flamelloidesc39193_g1_i1.p1 GENE.c39193_g1_i1~~c39193_g1_i1.p1  ORF type:complete len:326 (+),score=41.19 c39193_g1_i1:40-1017(+)